MLNALPLVLLLVPVMPAIGFEGDEVLRAAAGRGLAVVERGARNYPSHRRCFSCHHQTLPLLAGRAVGRAGLPVNETVADEIVAFTTKSFENSHERLAAGERIGGRSATVTYALWAYELAGTAPNDLTGLMVEYLLRRQDEDGGWSPPSQRPPFMQSRLTLATLALIGFERYGTPDRAERIAVATQRARDFLERSRPVTQEDRNARLWGLFELGFEAERIAEARAAVLAGQHDDGGFGQVDDRSPDAYATGQTIWTLQYTGTPADDPVLRRAADFLLDTQETDGSWYVRTRVVPVQVYFDNGDPHGRDQFIALPATAWAVAGLAALLPEGALPEGASPEGASPVGDSPGEPAADEPASTQPASAEPASTGG